jgi:hypothetical protein
MHRSIRAADDVLVMLDRLFTSNISGAPSLRRGFPRTLARFRAVPLPGRRITAAGWMILCLAWIRGERIRRGDVGEVSGGRFWRHRSGGSSTPWRGSRRHVAAKGENMSSTSARPRRLGQAPATFHLAMRTQ